MDIKFILLVLGILGVFYLHYLNLQKESFKNVITSDNPVAYAKAHCNGIQCPHVVVPDCDKTVPNPVYQPDFNCYCYSSPKCA